MAIIKVINQYTGKAFDFDTVNGLTLFADNSSAGYRRVYPQMIYQNTVGNKILKLLLENGSYIEFIVAQKPGYDFPVPGQIVPYMNGAIFGGTITSWTGRMYDVYGFKIKSNYICIVGGYDGKEYQIAQLPSSIAEANFNREVSHYFKGDYKYAYSDDKARTDISKNKSDILANTNAINNLSTKVDNMELFKFPNATIIGTPTINNGQISNFSAENYLKFPFLVDFKNLPFEITTEFTTGTNITSQENLFDSDFGLAFAVRDSKFVIAISDNGTSWLSEGVGTHTVNANTTYLVKLGWDKTNYTLKYSTDGGNTWTDDITIAHSIQPYPKQIYIGVGQSSTTVLNYFTGIINFNKTTLTVNSELVWQGMDDVGLASRLATDLSNIDPSGEEEIKDIVSRELTMSEYIDLPEEEKLNGTTYYVKDADASGDIIKAGTMKPWEYSEEETVVGVFEGKPLYRKIISIEEKMSITKQVSTAIDTKYTDSICNVIDKIVNACFYRYDDINNNIVYIPIQIERNPENSTLRYFSADSWGTPAFIELMIEYTKNTDAEGSGNSLMPYGYVGGMNNNYSTEEQIVGKWIDGRNVYQKTIEFETFNLPKDGMVTKSITSLIPNIDFCISLTACDVTKKMLFPYVMGGQSGVYTTGIVYDGGTLYFTRGTSSAIDLTPIVTLQYTKTTD